MHQRADVRVEDSKLSNRKRYFYGWAIVGVILLIDVLRLQLGGYSVGMSGVAVKGATILKLVCAFVVLRGVQRIPRYRQLCLKLRYSEVSNTVAWVTLLFSFVTVVSVLSYLCITINTPLVENSLVRFDQAVGFDWPGVYRWVQSHAPVRRIFAVAYASGLWQLIAIPIVLGISGRREDLSTFFFLLALSSLYLLLVSTPFPATSAFEHFKVADADALASVSDFSALRDGSMRTFDLTRMQGLVSLPSFHTALAVIFVYSLRRVRFLFWLVALLDLILIASTPTQGGHYLADVIAGVVLAVLTIVSVTIAIRWKPVTQCSALTRIARHITFLFAALNDRLRGL